MAIANLSAATSLPERSTSLVTFKILSEGEDLTPHIGVISISIQQAVNRVGFAILQLSDGDIPGQRMPVSDQDWFLPGKEIEIQVGYHLQESTLFKGLVTRHEVKVLACHPVALIVECRHPAYQMTRLRRSAYYDNITDSDIFAQIANDYSLKLTTDTTATVHPTLVQHHCTDWDFILTRADQQGLLVNTPDGELRIKKPDVQAQPLVSLSYTSQQIVSFEACLDARHCVPGVKAASWSPEDQAMAVESANLPITPPQQGNVGPDAIARTLHNTDRQHWHGADLPPGAAQEWADAQMLRHCLAAVRGRVCIIGNDQIKPMDWISFDGFGDRFNGPAFVSGLSHEIAEGVWYTHIEFGMDPDMYGSQVKDIAAPPAGGINPPVHGLHVGIVTKNEDDSGKSDGQRIRVRIPQIQADGDGVWARLSSPFAGDRNGKNYGWAFRPEIGDEVLVGFLDDDPNHPVVLGSLFSQNRTSPVSAADDNPEKGIFLREGMRLIFNDSDKSVTLLTQGGNKLKLSDNDQKILLESQHGAKLEMSAQGITLDAGSGLVSINGSRINLG